VDYGALATRVVAVVEGEPVNLIETLAGRIANVCLAEPRVEQVEVTVHKPFAPVAAPLDDVTVTIRRSRS
jgi:dihydroneopterin aldolase